MTGTLNESTVRTLPCTHVPRCAAAGQPGELGAKVIATHPEQGWNLLCNGVITFDDTGAISAGRVIAPHRAAA